MYVYTCIYDAHTYIHVYVYIYIYIYMHIYIHTHTHTHISCILYIYTHIHTYEWQWIGRVREWRSSSNDASLHGNSHISLSTSISLSLSLYISLYMICMYVYIYICIYIYTYIYIYIYIYIWNYVKHLFATAAASDREHPAFWNSVNVQLWRYLSSGLVQQRVRGCVCCHRLNSYESWVWLKWYGGPSQSSETIITIYYFKSTLFNTTPLGYICKQSTVDRALWSFSELWQFHVYCIVQLCFDIYIYIHTYIYIYIEREREISYTYIYIYIYIYTWLLNSTPLAY